GAGGLPFMALPRGLELSDVPSVNPECYALVEDPFSGESYLAVPALRPDVALIHAAEADARGNCGFKGSCFTDRLMALAARHVIVQVERLVSTDEVSAYPAGSALPGFLVDAVVVAPGGCLPTAAHGEYGYDESALRRYLELARDEAGFVEYVERHVLGRVGVA
ncbi:MAG TPA: CoA-transferase, partial [Actinomycetota bacterium]|nr:CoA-transferase [Actinomycetota bacterium]